MPTRPFPSVAAIAALTVPALVTGANAAPIPETFVYQGSLNDAGSPANGMYDITVSLYNNPVGGVAIGGTETLYGAVEVVDGLFELDIDFSGASGVLETDQSLYLEFRVKETGTAGTVILEPRVAITPAPIAHVSLKALEAQRALTANVTLQDAYNLGNTIYVTPDALSIRNIDPTERASLFLGPAESGLNEGSGSLFLFDGGGQRIANLQESSFAPGAWLQLYQDNLTYNIRLEPDFNGGGGYFDVARSSDGAVGFSVDGNASGTESTVMRVAGEDTYFQVDTTTSGDASVDAPIGSISSGEIHNEVGAAETSGTTTVNLSDEGAVVDVINSVTIFAPEDGFALVIASAEVEADHVGGLFTSATIGVSISSLGFASNTDLEIRIPDNAPSGQYDYPVTVHAIFPVTTGANTFYFLGDDNSTGGATFTVFDRQVSAIYIPTAYGSLARGTDPGVPDEHTPVTAPMNAYDILAEQNASLQADNERQQRELNAMRERMTRIERSLKKANTPDR